LCCGLPKTDVTSPPATEWERETFTAPLRPRLAKTSDTNLKRDR
jgi:hypothetical protein